MKKEGMRRSRDKKNKEKVESLVVKMVHSLFLFPLVTHMHLSVYALSKVLSLVLLLLE
jgi:hypothetical protein